MIAESGWESLRGRLELRRSRTPPDEKVALLATKGLVACGQMKRLFDSLGRAGSAPRLLVGSALVHVLHHLVLRRLYRAFDDALAPFRTARTRTAGSHAGCNQNNQADTFQTRHDIPQVETEYEPAGRLIRLVSTRTGLLSVKTTAPDFHARYVTGAVNAGLKARHRLVSSVLP